MTYQCLNCKKEIERDAKICGFCRTKTPVGRRKPVVRIILGSIMLLAGINGMFTKPHSVWDGTSNMSLDEKLIFGDDVDKRLAEGHTNGAAMNFVIGVSLIIWGWKKRVAFEKQLSSIQNKP